MALEMGEADCVKIGGRIGAEHLQNVIIHSGELEGTLG